MLRSISVIFRFWGLTPKLTPKISNFRGDLQRSSRRFQRGITRPPTFRDKIASLVYPKTFKPPYLEKKFTDFSTNLHIVRGHGVLYFVQV